MALNEFMPNISRDHKSQKTYGGNHNGISNLVKMFLMIAKVTRMNVQMSKP
jgi:hypothetical protein